MDTQARIERFIVDELVMSGDGIGIDPDQSLIASGVLDSLSLLRLISFIEEQFGVTIEDDEVIPDNFETINVIKAFVDERVSP